MSCQNADYAERSRYLHFLSRGFRGVHTRFFHLVKGFSAGVFDLIFQRVSGFAHALGYSACALSQVFLDTVAVLANPLVLEVGGSECTGNRGPNGKAYGAKHERLSFKQIRKRRLRT